MTLLRTGIISKSLKENEARVPIHPLHLKNLGEDILKSLLLEKGYGERFGVSNSDIQKLGISMAERSELLESCDIIILPKPLPEDLEGMRQGAILFGWPHCVQQQEITQLAIDRRLTLIAFEAMFHWQGSRGLHVFYKNNQLAGYCAILHALELTGMDGYYGPRKKALILGFGSVSRGAVSALQGRGFTDIRVFSEHPLHFVQDQILGCQYGKIAIDQKTGKLIGESEDGTVESLPELLFESAIIVNGILQDTNNPYMYIDHDDESRLRKDTLIVDVSCDKGMGFPFARPTSFESPIIKIGRGTSYYAVDHTPSYLWNASSWEISRALIPYLHCVMSGQSAWPGNETISRAIEIHEGIIKNQKILSFQRRNPSYPHEIMGSSVGDMPTNE